MKKYWGNTEETFQTQFLWLNNAELFKKPRIEQVVFGQYITDKARETCKLNLFLSFREEKALYFTS